jgi:aspartyl-tRNA(Asn)/glutamyl-tRNA(Gln) amidotransferase subunit A
VEPIEGTVEVAGLRIGIPETYFWEALDPGVETVCRRALASLEGAGASLVPVTFETAPVIKLTRAAGMAEAFVYHEPYLREHPEAYGDDIRPRLLAGQFVLAHDYVRAMRVRRMVAEEMTRVLSVVDVLAMPTVPVPAYPIPSLWGGAGMPRDPMLALRNTMVFNQTGHPAISLPAGLTEAGLPVGLQLAASSFDDFRLLAVAEAVEAVLAFSPVPPVLTEAGVPA